MIRLAGMLALTIAALGLWIWAAVDVAQVPSERMRRGARVMWLVVVVLTPPLGPVAWLVLRDRYRVPRARRPVADRPRAAPDDDPEFLRRLDERLQGDGGGSGPGDGPS